MINWLRNLICPKNVDNSRINELEAMLLECGQRNDGLRKALQEFIKINEDLIADNTEISDIIGAYFFKFEDKRQITRSQCMRAFKPMVLTDIIQAFADNLYFTVSKEEMEKFLENDKTNLRKFYVSEYFDCDDFAFRLKGNITTQNNADVAFFIIWTGAHAFNAFIDHNHKVWFIEPQTDEILNPDDVHHHYYKGLKVIIG